jgi:transposase InsO family protein
VRTRHRAPKTNGVVERFFGSLKYEHLYRLEIERVTFVFRGDAVEAFCRRLRSL